jgi:hypothetical protein
VQLSGKTGDADDVDDAAGITTLTNIFYRAIYCKEAA